MNTCLSQIVLKLNKIDARYIRMIFIVLALIAGGGSVLGLPMAGDVGG